MNGSLLQTLNLPKLSLIAAKDDIFFTTTKLVKATTLRFDIIYQLKLQDDQLNMAVFLRYLGKSDLSSVHVYSSINDISW